MDQEEDASVLYVYLNTRKEEYHVHSLDWVDELTRPWSRRPHTRRVCSRLIYFGPQAMPELHLYDQGYFEWFHTEVVNRGGVYLGPGRCTVGDCLDFETEGECDMADGEEPKAELEDETAVETETEPEVEVEAELRTMT